MKSETLKPPAPAEPGSTSVQEYVQFGALCWRRIGERLEVLLITSRETGRWVIPKGWPIKGLSPAESAAREAFEEAGVQGVPRADSIGQYVYDKVLGAPQDARPILPCLVSVYPLKVKALADRFPESRERRRKWFTPRKAARKVAEPELQTLLAAFVAQFKPDDAATPPTPKSAKP